MSLLAVFEEDEPDLRCVQDALAFIDAFYAAANEPSDRDGDEESTDGETDSETVAVDSLREALVELYNKLTAMGPYPVIHATALPLTQLVMGPRVLASECNDIQERLDACRLHWSRVLQLSRMRSFAPLSNVAVADLLRRRLDEIVSRVAGGGSERPILEQRQDFEEISTKYFDQPQRGVAVRFRTGRFIPFKLSILTKAIWSVVVDGALSIPGQSLAAAFEHRDEILTRFREDVNATEGVIAMRRLPLPDGSVLICWSAVAAAPYALVYHPQNIIGDLEIHQIGWIRIGRIAHGTSQSPRVFLEGVSDFVVRPASDVSDPDQEVSNRSRFERFRALMQAVSDAGGDKQQLLENRMLDATRGGDRRQQ